MNDLQKQALQTILEKAVDRKKVFGTSFCIKYQGDLWSGQSGNFTYDQPYFIASTTKLFVSAIFLQFHSKGILSLEDKIGKFLDKQTMQGLHYYNGKDYAGEITLKNLLAHTSGIPDYFQNKGPQGISLETELKSGKDQSWTFAEAVERSKKMKPMFIPGTKGKAHYSDTNFQLLGKIMENLTQRSVAENFDELIIHPLGLQQTYLYSSTEDQLPKNIFFKDSELPIPGAMSSFGADGGVVSTSEEMMMFIESFFNGEFFPASVIKGLKVWNSIFYPVKSGIGIHRFRLPWLFNPTGVIPELIGHSGLSGAMAYANPEKQLYITGTVNQIAYPETSFRLAIRLIQKLMAK
jgi:D-alanyl-D-alanine carboxypeptidase